MKIHVISDTHVEFYPEWAWDEMPFPKVKGDVCILGGDICTARQAKKYENYIMRLQENFEEVIFIAGNHEFYGMSMQEGIEELQAISDRTGSHFLDIHTHPSVTIKGVRFWGSTLWTDFGKGEFKDHVEYSLSDYRVIRGLNSDVVEDIHVETKALIDLSADVIITHHMPVFREHSKYPVGPITYGFCCTGMEDMVERASAKFWVYGHTHDNQRETIGGTELLSNQAGYMDERIQKSYDPYLILEIPS